MDQPTLRIPNLGVHREEWILDGKFHRKDGPAREWINGAKSWWIHGYRHRLDGPAIIHQNGEPEYYISSVYLSKQSYKQFLVATNYFKVNYAT
jgi:hypothetical protein